MSPRPYRRFAGRPRPKPGGRGGRRDNGPLSETAAQTALLPESPARGPVELPSIVSVGELAELLGLAPAQVIKALIGNGIFATQNQEIDFDTAAIVASDLGLEVRERAVAAAAEEGDGAAAADGAVEEEDQNRVSRPPVVTVMGHVDHGKTSLLDAIRETKVTSREAGGITQHIGAYQVDVSHEGEPRKITFLDTPGHEAFTAMRARGAQATDVAVLVVAADDGVMPQTLEAIDHARAANVPIVIALNKIDRPNANPDRVKQQLASEANLVIREYGGEVEITPVSAKTREGIEELLETILLVAEADVDPKANPNRPASGVVVEAKMDKARGPVATVLIQEGSLNVGDIVTIGATYGRVKALFNDRGKRIRKAEPASPVEILGLNGVPTAGDRLQTMHEEKTARQTAAQNQRTAQREAARPEVSLEDLFSKISAGEVRELNIIVKADVQGSVEPLVTSLERLGEEGIRVKVVHTGIGNVTESDVMLASASKAIVLGFNIRIEPGARRTAEAQSVDIRLYDVIYNVVDDVRKALQGLAGPKMQEVTHGHAEVRQVFRIGRNYAAAGCLVMDGSIFRTDRARVRRNGEEVFDGKIVTLRRFKDDAREVQAGTECGIALERFSDFQEGDEIESYGQEEVSRSA
jgi:translation initiation factor IF-2